MGQSDIDQLIPCMETRFRFKTECKKWRASEDANQQSQPISMNDETTPAFAHHLVPVLFAPAVVNDNAFSLLDSVGKLFNKYLNATRQMRAVSYFQGKIMYIKK
jgi:hypothetical protein